MPDHCLCNRHRCAWPDCTAADEYTGADQPPDAPSPCGDMDCRDKCERIRLCGELCRAAIHSARAADQEAMCDDA